MKKPPWILREYLQAGQSLFRDEPATEQEMHELAEYRCALITSEFAVPVEPRQQRRLEFARWLAQRGKISG